MWKIVVAFIVFAGLALFMLSRGGNIDMGGEKHGDDAAHAAAAAASPGPNAIAASAPTVAASH